jgi:hypothetical protein
MLTYEAPTNAEAAFLHELMNDEVNEEIPEVQSEKEIPPEVEEE